MKPVEFTQAYLSVDDLLSQESGEVRSDGIGEQGGRATAEILGGDLDAVAVFGELKRFSKM